jgi:hypothetical protein
MSVGNFGKAQFSHLSIAFHQDSKNTGLVMTDPSRKYSCRGQINFCGVALFCFLLIVQEMSPKNRARTGKSTPETKQ